MAATAALRPMDVVIPAWGDEAAAKEMMKESLYDMECLMRKRVLYWVHLARRRFPQSRKDAVTFVRELMDRFGCAYWARSITSRKVKKKKRGNGNGGGKSGSEYNRIGSDSAHGLVVSYVLSLLTAEMECYERERHLKQQIVVNKRQEEDILVPSQTSKKKVYQHNKKEIVDVEKEEALETIRDHDAGRIRSLLKAVSRQRFRDVSEMIDFVVWIVQAKTAGGGKFVSKLEEGDIHDINNKNASYRVLRDPEAFEYVQQQYQALQRQQREEQKAQRQAEVKRRRTEGQRRRREQERRQRANGEEGKEEQEEEEEEVEQEDLAAALKRRHQQQEADQRRLQRERLRLQQHIRLQMQNPNGKSNNNNNVVGAPFCPPDTAQQQQLEEQLPNPRLLHEHMLVPQSNGPLVHAANLIPGTTVLVPPKPPTLAPRNPHNNQFHPALPPPPLPFPPSGGFLPHGLMPPQQLPLNGGVGPMDQQRIPMGYPNKKRQQTDEQDREKASTRKRKKRKERHHQQQDQHIHHRHHHHHLDWKPQQEQGVVGGGGGQHHHHHHYHHQQHWPQPPPMVPWPQYANPYQEQHYQQQQMAAAAVAQENESHQQQQQKQQLPLPGEPTGKAFVSTFGSAKQPLQQDEEATCTDERSALPDEVSVLRVESPSKRKGAPGGHPQERSDASIERQEPEPSPAGPSTFGSDKIEDDEEEEEDEDEVQIVPPPKMRKHRLISKTKKMKWKIHQERVHLRDPQTVLTDCLGPSNLERRNVILSDNFGDLFPDNKNVGILRERLLELSRQEQFGSLAIMAEHIYVALSDRGCTFLYNDQVEGLCLLQDKTIIVQRIMIALKRNPDCDEDDYEEDEHNENATDRSLAVAELKEVHERRFGTETGLSPPEYFTQHPLVAVQQEAVYHPSTEDFSKWMFFPLLSKTRVTLPEDAQNWKVRLDPINGPGPPMIVDASKLLVLTGNA